MQPERWGQIEEIFQSAIDCSPQNRTALLDSTCGNDTELRREVESLLALHEEGGCTGSPAFEDGFKVLEQLNERVDEGRRIGTYRVLREIGRGGMGTVYLAARADAAFEKLVAIKIIRRGLDTEDIIQRFRSERQILAMLDHANIARLLDGGTTEDGLPYFVMEYIEGEPIDLYCDQRKLTITERLKLFQGVCAAVRYAHQNLVIHRDVKPGNVLVTKEGVPRLLDFGIAKLLAPGSSPGERTLTGPRPLTPEYASPEQIRGETITTASDVYSLGVLLYELLTGKKPYRLADRTPAAMERVICSGEPERPSGVAESMPGRRLRGDLDNIVLMAMRCEPQRRYCSVEQFSEDIRRHLDGLPVIARSDAVGYRATKFVGRHKAGVAAATLLVLTLTVGAVATAWQARVARLETAKAQRINSFLQNMLSFSSPGYASPNSKKDPDVKVSQVVEQAAKRAESELADQPEVLVDMQRTIGEIYYSQGRYDQAEQILRTSLEKRKRLYGEDSHETAETLNLLANTLLRKGAKDEAEMLFRRGIEIERNQAKRGHLDVRAMAHALGDYGSMLDQVENNAAEPYLREALQYASRLTGKDRAFLAMIENDLGNLVSRRGAPEADRLFRAAIDEYRKLPAGAYAEMGTTLSNLAADLTAAGKYDEAEAFVREALELRQKVLGNAHPDTSMTWHRLSDVLYNKRDYPAAESASREAIEVYRRAFNRPQDSFNFALLLNEQGMILNKMGRPREAEASARQALEIRARFLAPGHRLIASSKGVLGDSLRLEKRYAEAEPILLESYNILKSTAGEQWPRTKEVRQSLKALYESWHKPDKAVAY
jgi:serine/threonine protein kinase